MSPLVYNKQVRLVTNSEQFRRGGIYYEPYNIDHIKIKSVDNPVFQVFIIGHVRFYLFKNHSFWFYCRIIIINFLTGIHFYWIKSTEKKINLFLLARTLSPSSAALCWWKLRGWRLPGDLMLMTVLSLLPHIEIFHQNISSPTSVISIALAEQLPSSFWTSKTQFELIKLN